MSHAATKRVPFGMIHGRFQPFHNGHLAYALGALARCDHLIVGITNPDPSTVVEEAADPQRHRPDANPLTYFERQRVVRAALAEAGVPVERFSVVPFPIHHPERWIAYAPAGTRQYIRLFSDWGREKRERFEQHGWPVEVLDEGQAKDVSGEEIRRRLLTGDDISDLAPNSVAAILREIDLAGRLRRLTAE